MAAVSFVRMDYEVKNKVKRSWLYSFQRPKLDWIASEIVEIHLWLKKITLVTQKSPWGRKDAEKLTSTIYICLHVTLGVFQSRKTVTKLSENKHTLTN